MRLSIFKPRQLLCSLGAVLLALAWLARSTPAVLATEPVESEKTLRRIKLDQSIRIGMYLGFEGLSFRDHGRLSGLEVELAHLVTQKLSEELRTPIQPKIVNQEWSQIIKMLRDEKYDIVFSAIIPSQLYNRYRVRYSRSYLDTGAAICCRKVDGKPVGNITEKVESLRGKRIVVINDPAVRSLLRKCGVYVEKDEGSIEFERHFPRNRTLQEMQQSGNTVRPLIPVAEIRQLDEMPEIYEMIARGDVDAGVIDLGIIWWVSTASNRWSQKIHAFPDPIGPYIYCATTREEDVELSESLDRAIELALQSPEYAAITEKWHGPVRKSWQLAAEDFLKTTRPIQVDVKFATEQSK